VVHAEVEVALEEEEEVVVVDMELPIHLEEEGM
jgi:hypothetical protein